MQTKKIPMRQCVGCRESKSKKDLIRIIKDADNNISVDFTGKKNGRGAYICNDSNCLEKAIKTKALDRSFKMTVSKEVYDSLREELGESDGK